MSMCMNKALYPRGPLAIRYIAGHSGGTSSSTLYSHYFKGESWNKKGLISRVSIDCGLLSIKMSMNYVY